ncbi:riboflavin synthase [Flavihumibacter rivuli]|uniref:riboflavin synthase n=1 Tax=Flavihumibacter rivuli TaxID=2838156 RepID=UPI001BDF33FB|nr:riboflavin synthase [Flavihumibacter rivuli]ULQ58158.1 riboflavin synthase [Flavihumibacter rivuli]
MFTGIIESLGTIAALETSGTNKIFWVSSPISHELKIDQSVAHNGVCLTVDALKDGQHRVTAIAETLEKTNLGELQPGDLLNLERCMVMNGRIDGHIVQGHVDGTGTCTGVKDLDGSWEYRFSIDPQFAPLIIEKGSICINGTSLTLFNVTTDSFSVAIIPYTYEHTNINQLVPGSKVNLEFDMIGKYVNRLRSLSTGT